MSTMIDLRGRNLMKLSDFSPEEITYLIDLAAELKAAKREGARSRSSSARRSR
jgi:ornithine carbamoyltransferase